MALQPAVVQSMLMGYNCNYAPTSEDRAQGIAYVTSIIQRGFFNDESIAAIRFPQGGPLQLAHQAFSVLTWAFQPDRDRVKMKPHEVPFIMGRLKAVRHLHEWKAPPILLLHADRELAAGVRSNMRDHKLDPDAYRDELVKCGFSIVPVQVFLEEAASSYRAISR
jgi:hypothetical protein